MEKKIVIKTALITLSLLLIPLVVMQFYEDMKWSWFDFAIAGVLLFGTGLIFQWATRKVEARQHRIIIGAMLMGLLVLVWGELAVGTFGTPIAGS